MGKLIMAYWDCRYCDTKGNRGDARECPNCGHPRDESVKFYMKDKTYVSEEKAATINRNPDWLCSFCNTLNSDDETICKSCSASRADSEKNYYDLHPEQKNASSNAQDNDYKDYIAKRNEERAKAQAERQKALAALQLKKRKKSLIIGGALLLGLILLLLPKKREATIDSVSWERNIEIEQYRNVDENDWELPEGANLHTTKQEIHHYNHVIDHYEDVQVQKSREVLDGYDTNTTYTDMGNGYYEESTYQTPRYRTEYYYETESQPVYRDDPVYQTKYYYDIWKWVFHRNVTSSANDHNPYWGDTKLAEDEREGERSETYEISVSTKKGKTYRYEVSFDVWNDLYEGDKLTIKAYPLGNDKLLDDNGDVIAILYD